MQASHHACPKPPLSAGNSPRRSTRAVLLLSAGSKGQRDARRRDQTIAMADLYASDCALYLPTRDTSGIIKCENREPCFGDMPRSFQNGMRSSKTGKKGVVLAMRNRKFCVSCGRELEEGDLFCGWCGQAVPPGTDPYPDVDENGRRGRWESDTRHCPECRKAFHDENDQFCRYCGSKRTGEAGRFFVRDPYNFEPLYGPMPVQEAYRCTACGFEWESSNWDRQFFCPQCGGNPIRTEKHDEIKVVGGREQRNHENDHGLFQLGKDL